MPITDDLPLSTLQKYWGYDSFRPLQREAIACALERRDSVVVLPTGGGKSICYQVPAICDEQKMAVVVSPLISLMKDQVDGLVANGIAAASLNSSLPNEEKSRVIDRLQRGELRLLYVSPERLAQDGTIEQLKQANVGFFAIDEAHCISSWGHDFRPEYRQLSKLKEHFPTASVHAFTATATPRVRDDIAKQLNLQSAEKLVGSFHRANLIYRVHRRSDALEQMRTVIDQYRDQSGIIYCISRKDVANVAATLEELGYRAKPYHAGMSDADRSANQDDFINERTDIIVATVAFGMGIDKSSVRYVIHNGMPKSLEAYQQESGRAGRDGLPSECCLLFSGADLMRWKKMSNGQPAAGELLEAMYGYCTQSCCRHRILIEYFGQEFELQDCGACDVCLNELDQIDDPLIMGQKILSCVHRVGQRFGAHHVASVLTGSAAKRILELGHEKLSTYNLLSEHSKQAVVEWIDQLVGQKFLAKTGEYNVLGITESGKQLLRGELTPKLFKTAKPVASSSKKRIDNWDGVDRGLFDHLRAFRRELAAEKEIPPFVIFHDASLREMARVRPSSESHFRNIPGVGEKKLADYGAAFVEKITEYCTENQIDFDQAEKQPAAPVLKTKQKLVAGVKKKAFELFRDGRSIEEVAEMLERALSTTSGYLSDYIRENKITDPSPWVAHSVAESIRAAANEVGELEKLAPIKAILGDDFSYEQIRAVVDCMRVETDFER